MEERTRAYLRGRFRDHYRRVSPTLPPAAERREWGYIPWTDGSGTTMVRHQSLLDIGDLGDFLQRQRPRHVYFSAGRYQTPGAGTMDAKGWQGSDLIFDLDADHLPDVTPETDSYRSMLAACKDALHRLLDFLREDFGFDESAMAVVFSGGRGYHVHVRTDSVLELDRAERREIVDYIRGIDVEFESLLQTETVAGLGRKTPTETRTLDTEGGWGRRIHRAVIAEIDALLSLSEADARDRLQQFEGIGVGRAESILRVARENREAIEGGNIDVHPDFFGFVRRLFERTLDRESAAIDEPVTTDIHRLIRLPGSLHGGSALQVTPIPLEELDTFDPLVDAVPGTFIGNEIRIDADGGPPVELNGETFTVPDGVTTLPEYAAAFLMARGRAEKERER
ncbi:MAG: DNA primase small subunit PriS [Halobacteriales archaeon]